MGQSARSCGTVQAESGPLCVLLPHYLAAPVTHTGLSSGGSAGPCALTLDLEGLLEETETPVTFRERPQNVRPWSPLVASGSRLVPLAPALSGWRVQRSPDDRLHPLRESGRVYA